MYSCIHNFCVYECMWYIMYIKLYICLSIQGSDWMYSLSDRSSIVLSGLQRASSYRVQVRARSQAGYGPFSQATSFSTQPEGQETPRLLLRPPGTLTLTETGREKDRRRETYRQRDRQTDRVIGLSVAMVVVYIL